MAENKNAPNCVAAQVREQKNNMHLQNSTAAKENQARLTADDLEAIYKAKYRVGQKLKLLWRNYDRLSKEDERLYWRPVEVVQMCRRFMTVRFLDVKSGFFKDKPAKGYCEALRYADLRSGEVKIK